MTKGIYRLVIAGMAVIALLAVIRSFAGGNDLAGARLGWGQLAFAYPGMWDLLGIVGSVIWVRTSAAFPQLRRMGMLMTGVAFVVVAFSLGAEGYTTARDVLPGGWPEPAFAAGVAVPFIYAWLTHLASRCADALEATPSTTSSDSATSPSTRSEPSPVSSLDTATTSPAIDSAPPSSSATTDSRDATLGPSPLERPGLAAPLTVSPAPESAPDASGTSPTSPSPVGGEPARTSPGPETGPARHRASTSSPAARPTTSPRSSGRATLPGDFFATSTASDSSTSSPSTPTTGETRSSDTATSDATTDDLEVVPDTTDLTGKDENDPASYGRDGAAPPPVRRQWIRDKRSLNIVVQGADVDRRFGPPRTGARLLRDVLSEDMEAAR